MKNLLIIVASILFPLATFSQVRSEASIKVKGQIMDSISSSSIPYATITIMKIPGNTVEKRMATDLDGFFEIPLKKSGNYMLVANSLGYSVLQKVFTVKEGQNSFNIGKLNLKQSSVELGEVQVVAEKPLVKVEADKLSYNAESDPDTKSSNALDMLKKVPLITVDGEDNVQLKGSSNYKVFVNGKPSTMASNNTKDFLRNLPASSIKNIEVITSPGAKYDAEGVGGIINIVTQKKLMGGYTCSLNAGTNTLGAVSGGASISAAAGKFGISANIFNYYQNNPYYKSTTYRIDTSLTSSYWNGKSKYKGMSPWGDGELSYEFDTLNLINASFSLWYARNKNLSNTDVSVKDKNLLENQSYKMNTINDYTFGAPEWNIDYQHTSKRNKEQIVTLSYKMNYNPTGIDGQSNIDNVLNYIDLRQTSDNEAYSIEHTFQADFVKPLVNDYKLEMGAKYILRKNLSETDALAYDFTQQLFVVDSSQINDFDYTQNIYAGYFTVNKNIKNFGLKAGVRVEDVFTDGTFTSKSFTDFDNTNLEYVPSASVSYQINQANNLRLSYSKRIQRPDIWYLNPYVNKTDPKNINFGNPTLDPERFHNFELNFGSFSKLGNINLTLFNSFSNNAIDRWSVLEDGVVKSSYGNINKIVTWGASTYLSFRVGMKFNASLNGSINYNDIKGTNSMNMATNGWGYNAYSNVQYTIIKGLKASVYGMVFRQPVRLQSKTSTFYNMGVNLSKEFFNSKMVLTLNARNIFWDEMKFTFKSNSLAYYQESEMYRPGRSFGINISYRFGEMKSQIKKTQRGIENDDIKKGEGGSGTSN